MSGPIPFDHIRDASLAQAQRLLADWFPNGRVRGREFMVGNISGDPGESLSINLNTGKWADFATGMGGPDLIAVRAAMKHNSDRTAAAREMGPMLGIRMNGHDTGAKPLGANASGSGKKRDKNADIWHPIVPPPAGAPTPAKREFEGFSQIYDYLNPAGDRALFYIRRREARNGEAKQFIPLTFGELNGQIGWHAKAPGAPRPLYGLDRLAVAPDATVIVTEGEKACLAAQRLFPDYVCVTWAGGAKATEHADLTPLRDRKIIVWPDNDPDGHRAASALRDALPLRNGQQARILQVSDLPEGHDAADVSLDDPEAWLAERLVKADQPGSDTGSNGNGADPHPPMPGLHDYLAIEAWATRPIQEPDRLLGDLLTTTTRIFLVGRTGLGKTMLGFAIACGIASGEGFLHWRSVRPARVLYVDGEMPGELIKARSIDVLRRTSTPPPPGNLVIYSRDTEDDFAALFPSLGKMPPLNTEAGHNFVLALIDALGGVDAVVFDNVMSLLAGDQKDELPWTDTLPLVAALTTRRVGQVWLDHTGHNTERQYGSSTKAWRLDAVGVMTPLTDSQPDSQPDHQPNHHELAFTLSFEHPGKTRRRTPANWQDFETVTIRLKDDRWSSEPGTSGTADRKGTKRGRPMSDETELLRRTINNLACDETVVLTVVQQGMKPVRAIRVRNVHCELIRNGWFTEAVDYTENCKDGTFILTTKGRSRLRNALITLEKQGFCGFNQTSVWPA